MKKPNKTTKRRKKIERLLLSARGPMYEVRVIRGSWARPLHKLKKVSIAAAKQLNRRALDSLYNNAVVAVGTFKLHLAPEYLDRQWIGEIHAIVSGAEKMELEEAYGKARASGNLPNSLRVWKVRNLGRTLDDVFRRDLQEWSPGGDDESDSNLDLHYRAKYKKWRARVTAGALTLRYGCDRYFNELNKQTRVRQVKPKKKRAYPEWLKWHMFGSPKWTDIDPQDYAAQKPRSRNRSSFGPD